jgi:WS/DGAT/MGAT family acyltransferase
VPLGLNRPVRVDDEQFDLAYHVRRVNVPEPGDDGALRRAVGALVAERLDLARPPWRMYLIEGLAGGRTALLRQAHHALWDGMSEARSSVLETDGGPAWPGQPAEPWEPRRPPGSARLVTDALVDRAGELADAARAVLAARGAARIPGAAAKLRALREALRRAPLTPLGVPIGGERRVAWTSLAATDIRIIRRAFGGTTNDVALALVGGAVRHWLDARGAAVPREPLKIVCPVGDATQRADATDNFGRGPMMAMVPVAGIDPVARLAAVRAATAAAKATRRVPGAGLLGLVPGAVVSAVIRGVLRRGIANLVVSTVRGPRASRYLAGRRILEAHGFGFPLDHLALFVTVISYAGRVSFGLNADARAVADLDVIADGIEAALDELVHAARGARARGEPAIR